MRCDAAISFGKRKKNKNGCRLQGVCDATVNSYAATSSTVSAFHRYVLTFSCRLLHNHLNTRLVGGTKLL